MRVLFASVRSSSFIFSLLNGNENVFSFAANLIKQNLDMKRPQNNPFCLVTINFWSCYCLRFEFLRLKKLTPIMETQVVTVSVFLKNKILEVRTIFEAISKQNKCKFLWLPNKKLIFRGLFISKFNFICYNARYIPVF